MGIKVGRQNYTYYSAGEVYKGENIYGILQAPRGDATEAIVLVAAWESIDARLNRNGVALALTLVRYFKRKFAPLYQALWYTSKATAKNAQAHRSGRLVSMVQGHHCRRASR